MLTFATLPLAAVRAGPCVRQIFVAGLDLTGWALAAQVRLQPDTPGAALLSLAGGVAAGAEGVRLVGVVSAGGVPTSQLELRIAAGTLTDANKLPYSGEQGDASVLSWALAVTPPGGDLRMLAQAPFVLLPTTFGSDGAPTDRPASLGPAVAAGTWNSATLTVSDQSVTFVIDGADLIAPMIKDAKAARDDAQAALAEAQLAAATAQAVSRYFPTRAAGEAASAVDQAFATDDGAGSIIYYRRTAGGSTEIGRAVTPAELAGVGGAAAVGTADGRTVAAALADANTIPLQRFGVTGNGSDETAAVQAWVHALIAGAPCVGTMNGLQPCVNEIDLSNANRVTIDGGGGGLRPLASTPTSGRFIGSTIGTISFRNGCSVQTAAHNYKPSIDLYGDTTGQVRVDSWHFEGCGYGARFQNFNGGGADYCTGHQIGIYPRPSPLDPTAAGFGAAFEIYGAGIRAAFTPGFVFGDHNDFRNDQPAGGHTSDQTGGAGFFSMHACDGGKFGASYALNAPGQGFLGSGEWQGQDVVGAMLAGTFDFTLRGKDYVFDGCRAEGCNEEGVTAFGTLRAKILNVRSRNNRFTSVEMWQSVDPMCIGGEMYEEASASHPIANVAGEGAIHVVECWNFKVISPKIGKARFNGVRVDGSLHGEVAHPTIMHYGADNNAAYLAAGVAMNVGLNSRYSTDVAVSGGLFAADPANTVGADLFAGGASEALYQWGNRNASRALTVGGYAQSFLGQPQLHTAAPILLGGAVGTPRAGLSQSRTLHVGTSATAILALTPFSAGQRDSFLVLVNGEMDTDPGTGFTDLVIVVNGGSAARLGGDRVGSAPSTTYGVSGGNLTIALSTGAASVTCVVLQAISGSQYL